ncbi:hypothetical protein CPB83DRAFT_842258 [Crepidotus variabilis]|uniref:GYF domain-containing protein n=1 Tax=Crepidotus variabilis TaxID=179855 RepID=A0A9P6JWJ2_9AGAR|nr:hypothetical protein CPB83DRAFT_842258 [Crepidotus variabilis]
MSTTTMHFGPEWMRTKHQPTSRPQHPPSPPPANGLPASASGTSTYSSLVSATPPAPSDKIDDAHPFRYSKEEMLSIFQEGGGKGGLGIEVERWEGVVRELAADPVALREMSETEKKLFAGSLNSEMRRRPSQSTDFLSPLNTSVERPRMLHSVSATTNSPLRERFGGLKRRDSSGGTADLSTLPIPRKPSISALPSPGGMHSPRDVVPPRTRVGHTPNFDGVLNNGESWVARRRASEASMKAATRDGQTLEQAPVTSGIREEKEEDHPAATQQVNGDGHASLSSSSPDYNGAVSGGTSISNDVVQMGAEHNVSGIGSSGNERTNIVSPPGLIDPNTIQWSYKDPTGQTQGPFTAEIMHSWHKGGYFTPDLPMKRIHVDEQWITLQDLVSQATTDNIFLTPPRPVPPPGLNRTSPMRGYSTQEHVFNEPYQPAPLRSLRTSTLESFMGGADSPSSSFGASQFSNSSPDPTAFGGRENRAYFASDINGRTGFGMQNQQHFPSNSHGGMEYNHDYGAKTQTPLYGNFLDRGLNSHASINPLGISQEPWPMASGIQSFGLGPPITGLPSHLDHPQSLYGQEVMGRSFSQNSNSASYTESVQQHQTPLHLNSLGYINQFEASAGSPYSAISEKGHQLSNQVDFGHQQQSASGFGLQALEPINSQIAQPPSDSFSIPTQSPWNTVSDPVINSALTVVEEPLVAGSEDYAPNTLVAIHVEDAPNFIPADTTSSSPAELSDALNQKLSLDESDTQTTTESTSASESSAPAPSTEPTKRSKKSKAGTKVSVDIIAPVDQSSAVTKSAWAKDEGGKKSTSTSVSLRDIQEAEAKKQESRKAAEREKERARVTGSIIETKEDAQPFTAAWGLPTSQAGNRTGVSLSIREPLPTASPSSATTPATPVWAAPPKTPAAKKSMKEIQEEEEKRKKQVAAKESAAAAAQKRAYAETMAKNAPSPSPVAPVNTVWTTVGANGKTAAAAAAAAASPTRPSAPSTTASSSRVPTTSTHKPAANSVVKARPSTKVEEISETPSHDFLKWLGDSLKGLNNSVNVEEIMAMLLSFPIDADSSTQEIISDTIYANSTTLDGRRFASEFVTKRKADAATRPKGSALNNGKVATKSVSIADVVKSVPKPAQPEWGFKVVNKKKKGGKA